MASPTNSSVDLRTFNPFEPATLQCPFPHYAAMRATTPIHEVAGLGIYMVTRHDPVLEVVRDPETYSNKFGQTAMPLRGEDRDRLAAVVAEGYPRVSTMLTSDPPEHTRYRRLVTRCSRPRRSPGSSRRSGRSRPLRCCPRCPGARATHA